MKFAKQGVMMVMVMSILAACKKDEPEEEVVETPITSGFVIGCEGTFGLNNAEVFWVSDAGVVKENLYATANGTGPGDVLQHYTEFNGKGYIVMNNSQKVNITNAANQQALGVITGCDYPRYFLPLTTQKAYLTNGSFDGEVMIVNLTTGQISSSIPVGKGPEEMTYNGTHVFVANSGGWDYDNTVTVIDPLTDAVVQTITVGDRPVAMEADYQGNVWVLCSGHTYYDANWNITSETQPQLMRIDGSSFVVTAILNVGDQGDHPTYIERNSAGNELYVLNGGIQRLPLSTGTFTVPIVEGDFGAMAVHPETGEFMLTSVPDYV
ncbi:MAG: hypothetical protein RL226_67, partial [Bacteroidota bacterium]